MCILDMVNVLSNKKLFMDLVNLVLELGKKFGYDVQVFDQEKIIVIGFDVFFVVNWGSEYLVFFIIMEYKLEGFGEYKKIGLVGKGVIFDIGGLFIKFFMNMYYMKSDMGGVVVVFGMMEVVVKFKLLVYLIGIVLVIENSVDVKVVKLSDVINLYSGKIIEIIDMDVEG